MASGATGQRPWSGRGDLVSLVLRAAHGSPIDRTGIVARQTRNPLETSAGMTRALLLAGT